MVMTVVSIPSIVVHSILVPLRSAIVLLISNKDVSGDKEVLEMRRTAGCLMTNGGRFSGLVVVTICPSTSPTSIPSGKSIAHKIAVPLVVPHNNLNGRNGQTNAADVNEHPAFKSAPILLCV